jgi:hypothetical protein
MNGDTERMREICLNYCVYYKPGKDENLACLGFLVIEKILEEGMTLDLEKRRDAAGSEAERMLVREMCLRCPFYPEDCDYIIEKGDAAPCGGFVALRGLIQERCITLREVGDAIDRIR